MIKNVFYDLDGTLLPMDMERFTGGYFKFLIKKIAPYGVDTDKVIPEIWAGTKQMVLNDGSKTNEDVFWNYFCPALGIGEEMKPVFEDFYANEFEQARELCGYNDKVPALIKEVNSMGLRQILATNPIFPEVATRKRTIWAGLSVDMFEAFTTYEDCHFCKPNVNYYRELMEKTGCKPEETLMIGNDVEEDIRPALSLGMKAFLVTDCMINSRKRDIEEFRHGDFDEALAYIRELTEEN